jgi:mannosyltransferase
VDARLLAGITLVAAIVRFAMLTGQSFWFDEAQAVHEMQLSFGAMLHAWSAYEPNPPLYFLLAWPWAQVLGTGEAAMRALPALLGTITVPLVYLCGRELVSRRAGLFAAALAALNPFLIWYATEAREYALLTALSAASVLWFARAWHGGGRRALVWWAIVSALALLTQYFAGFLVAAEAVALLWRLRDRAVVVALGALAVVEAALIPHLVGHAAHPASWIDSAGTLSMRLRQVPVAFALNTLYRGSAVSYGLWGAAVLLAVLIALLVAGAGTAELRGAGLAAGLAAAVLLVPLVLALAGRDYYEARALIPAWIPLAVIIGAACAASGARVAGTALAVVLGAAFVWSGIVIATGNPVYRRADWRGVASALGRASAARAIVAYDGTFATAPLAIYVPGVGWTAAGQNPQRTSAPTVTVGELDVVGDEGQVLARPLPRGVSLVSARRVDAYLVDRFRLATPVRVSRAALAVRATTLLGLPGGGSAGLALGSAVLVQRPSQ